MKIVLVDVAAKYIHTGLAVRYLYQCCVNTFKNTVILEKTINEPLDTILADIYREKPQVVGFSCYIWNITTILPVCKTLKEIMPSVKIVLGGPEVSFDSQNVLQENIAIDFVISGEGEGTLPKLLAAIQNNNNYADIKGLSYRDKKNIIDNSSYECLDLATLPITYDEKTLKDTKHRIIYYECSRGCPYRCAYCLSGLAGKVRFLPMERIKKELYYLAVKKQVKQIKFVDRTFNHNKQFTIEIFEYLKKLPGDTNFHFEIRADLLDEEVIEVLKDLPHGKFQFEIGVQSTNKETLVAINRPHNWKKIIDNVRAVKSLGTIHQHLDLIAGLPHENYNCFVKSFNDVYILQPEMLQLGFLKLIKGSKLWQNRANFGFKFRHYPPYEVLSTKWISYDEMLKLKDIEAVLELYYNSGNFVNTINYVVNVNKGFSFYESLAKWFRVNDLFTKKHSLEALFELLFNYLKECSDKQQHIYVALLKLDFLSHFMHRKLPKYLEHVEVNNYKLWVYNILKKPEVLNLLPQHQRDLQARQIIKFTHFEVFNINPLKTNDKLALPKKTVLMFYYNHVNKNWHSRKARVFDISNV
ncbi:B12-binding domain-containing radical SAM protein [Clostridium sp. 'deep sea']|uniref:B12-binding domain-containing radical SAM protein n=1 Tax=Clostridium sp. 'deep sea' TaxID=2779445 RepID=UPI0018967250|nr:B12-binding domain-containing radical SAM protein [Clostridium sp. 'deep sea']QOR34292.1 B12-binding domain-containing radical SAM protein [Clostridium sp. 'deep sea']